MIDVLDWHRLKMLPSAAAGATVAATVAAAAAEEAVFVC
jgi:hypothetical protein